MGWRLKEQPESFLKSTVHKNDLKRHGKVQHVLTPGASGVCLYYKEAIFFKAGLADMKVLIINQWATNKGDRAVAYFLMRELLRHGIKDITISTSNTYYWKDFECFPEATLRFIPFGWTTTFRKSPKQTIIARVEMCLKHFLFRKIAFPLARRALMQNRYSWLVCLLCTKEYLEAVKNADIVISTGGHRVTTLLVEDMQISAAFDMTVALLNKKPLLFWSQTIGPLEFKNSHNKAFVQKILKSAFRIAVRDEGSVSVLNDVNVSTDKVSKTRDSVFGLFDIVKNQQKPSERENILGISVYMVQKRSAEQRENYEAALSRLIDHATNRGCKVRFFPMQTTHSDVPCIKGIIKRCRNKDAVSIIDWCPETPEHIKMISECKLFVGHKTHSVVYALAVGTPVIAIAYHKKTREFMEQFGLQEYCISDEKLDGGKLVELFDKAASCLDEISARQLEHACRTGRRVQDDFGALIEDARNGLTR